ncbi:MAG: hypothetical protein BJ554DRAFT_2511 [Olpidium bornovanus]|uniref:Phosphatidate phosphatase APP1 catalytic domain-containing protein n=1 Tax=Olpidium bornovanus TaxID=278681 RepID=A0A8H7ZQC1_9FUNG|nr:MAG: hypothetical protein BJ554DRAFT_2511 [Olpidium bornovanus]
MANVYSHWWTRGFAMHYVSNTPYQLLPMLDAFFRCHGFPPGSTHLKIFDWRGPSRTSILSNPELGKRRHILSILKDFPKRKFILIGDSGERDLELYTKIARENPDRVLKIFIRDVTTPRLRRQMQAEAASAASTARRTFSLQLTNFEAIRHRTLKLRSKPWSLSTAAPVSSDGSSPDTAYAGFPSADGCALTEDVPPNPALRLDPPQTQPSSTASSPLSLQTAETRPFRVRRRSLTGLEDCSSPTDAVPNGSTGSGTAQDHRLADFNKISPSANRPTVPAVAAPVPQTANAGEGLGEASPVATTSPTTDAGNFPRHAAGTNQRPGPRRAQSPANPLAAFARRVAEATEGLPEGMCTLFEDSERLLLDESLQARLKEYCGL